MKPCPGILSLGPMLQLYFLLEAVLKLSQRRQSTQRKIILVVRGAVIVEALLLAQVLEADVAIAAGKSFRRALGILHSGHICKEVCVGLALQLLDHLDARGGVHPQPYATTRCDRRTGGSSP